MRPFSEADRSEFAKAIELEKQGDLEAAVETVGRLIESGVVSGAAYAKLGGLLWELDRTQEASVEFKKAVSQSPKWKVASLGLFHTLWDQGLQVEALEEAERFTELTGSDEYMEIFRGINECNRGNSPEESER